MVWPPPTLSPSVPKHGAATMNYEKQNGIANGRPVANGIKSPTWTGRGTVLPRVTGSLASDGSPTAKRESQGESQGEGWYTGGDNVIWKEDVATPVKTFLSSNITPRSGLRKARVESASSTPNRTPDGTPSLSRPVSSVGNHGGITDTTHTSTGLGIRGTSTGRTSHTESELSDGRTSALSPRPTLVSRTSSAIGIGSPEEKSLLFHASEVQANGRSRPSAERSTLQDEVLEHINLRGANDVLPPMGNSPTPDDQKSKFLYANAISESKPLPRVFNGNSINRPPLQTIYSAHAGTSPQRPASPLKEEFLPRKSSISKASPRRHTRLVSNGGTEIKSPETISYGGSELSRRSSLKIPAKTRASTHTRSSSVKSTGPSPSRRGSIGLSDHNLVDRSRAGSRVGARPASTIGASGALPNSNPPTVSSQDYIAKQSPSSPQSPAKSNSGGQNKLDQMNELAASARRERKVLDLEISNSSLLAINRTLEREMRKQKAELRRYRNLSRSGRLSIAPSSCSPSGKMSMLSQTAICIDSDNLLSPSASETDEEDDVDPDILSNLSSNSTTSRPSSATARAARARFLDAKRPSLDLLAQKSLLLDSQKMNQSIKRCLGHTESLISLAKQALEHEVQDTEAENLGPRVLTPDEFGGDALHSGQGLLSPSVGAGSVNPWERTLGNLGNQDGGLETPDFTKWGSPTQAQTPLMDPGGVLDFGITDDPTITANSSEGLETAAKEIEPTTNMHTSTLHEEKHTQSPISEPSDEDIDNDISIDGLEDEPFTESPTSAKVPFQSDDLAPQEENTLSKPPRPPSPLKPGGYVNVAGNRGSMQGLGHYLQSFSIFSSTQQT